MTKALYFGLFFFTRSQTSLAITAKSSPVVDILGSSLADQVISVVPDTSQYDESAQVIKGIAQVPAPKPFFNARLLDPQVQRASSCARDFRSKCPEGFVNIGTVKGGAIEYCRAMIGFETPCNDEVYQFSSMTIAEKNRWSDQCLAFWPCNQCVKDYKEPCPRDWSPV